ADFGFVVHAAERDAHELASERSRDGLAQRSFADPWRPKEAQDGTFHPRLQLFDRQVIEDALLYLFEVVVILVQDFLPVGDIDFGSSRGLRPRKSRHPFQIRACDHALSRSRSHLLQALQLAVTLLAGFGGHTRLIEFGTQLVDFRLRIIRLAELLLNRLHLLAEQIFALALADLLLHLLLNLVAQIKDFDLLG